MILTTLATHLPPANLLGNELHPIPSSINGPKALQGKLYDLEAWSPCSNKKRVWHNEVDPCWSIWYKNVFIDLDVQFFFLCKSSYCCLLRSWSQLAEKAISCTNGAQLLPTGQDVAHLSGMRSSWNLSNSKDALAKKKHDFQLYFTKKRYGKNHDCDYCHWYYIVRIC